MHLQTGSEAIASNAWNLKEEGNMTIVLVLDTQDGQLMEIRLMSMPILIMITKRESPSSIMV